LCFTRLDNRIRMPNTRIRRISREIRECVLIFH